MIAPDIGIALAECRAKSCYGSTFNMTSQHNHQSFQQAPARVLRQDVRDAGLMGSGHTAANPAGAPLKIIWPLEKFSETPIKFKLESGVLIAIFNEQIDAARERLCP